LLFKKNSHFGSSLIEKLKFKILNFKLRNNKQIVLKFIDGSNLFFSKNGGSITSSLIRDGNYSFNLIEEFSSRCLNKDELILNIGANIGTTARNFRYLGFKNIAAFEPVFENFSILQKNTDYSEINSYNIALGNETALKNINKNLVSNGRNSFLKKYSKNDVEKVIVVKLDSLKLQPKYIFMDVEGYELEVLEGSTNTLQSVEVLCLEFNLNENNRRNKVIDLVTEYFEFFQIFNNGFHHDIKYLKSYIDEIHLDQIDLILYNKNTK